MKTWNVNHPRYGPKMVCGHVPDLSDDAAVKLIRRVLKHAKREGVAPVSIVVNVDDESTSVTLVGTGGAEYR